MRTLTFTGTRPKIPGYLTPLEVNAYGLKLTCDYSVSSLIVEVYGQAPGTQYTFDLRVNGVTLAKPTLVQGVRRTTHNVGGRKIYRGDWVAIWMSRGQDQLTVPFDVAVKLKVMALVGDGWSDDPLDMGVGL